MPLDIIAIFLKEILENLEKLQEKQLLMILLMKFFSKFCLGK